MTKALTIVGTVMLAVGLVWTLKGLGYVGGSFMTGQQRWTTIGLITAVVGAFVLFWSNLRRS